jgi:hypothetical protein
MYEYSHHKYLFDKIWIVEINVILDYITIKLV